MFIALVIQYAKRMRRIVLYFVACLSLKFYSTLFREQQHFRGGGQGGVGRERIIQWDIFIYVTGSLCKLSVILAFLPAEDKVEQWVDEEQWTILVRRRGQKLSIWLNFFDVEYIYGFVWWGVCKQSRWRHSVTEPSQDGGYALLWKRFLHLQQYSHRLNFFF